MNGDEQEKGAVMTQRQKIAQERVRRAMELVERASDDLANAAEALSELTGATDERGWIVDLHYTVRRSWHGLRSTLLDNPAVQLDRDPLTDELLP